MRATMLACSIVRFGSSIVRFGSSIVRFGSSIVRIGSSIVRIAASAVRLAASAVRLVLVTSCLLLGMRSLLLGTHARADKRHDVGRDVYAPDEADEPRDAHAGDVASGDVTSGDVTSGDVANMVGIGARPPPVAEVLEAAYQAAGLDRDRTDSWRRRARAAGLIPWVTVRTGWDTNWREEDPDIGRSRTFEVRATWRLDRLLFDSRELQMSSIDAARRRERRRLASRVIQAYFGWRRVSARAARDSRFALAAEAATAELDALTEGWFSHWFSDRGKSAR